MKIEQATKIKKVEESKEWEVLDILIEKKIAIQKNILAEGIDQQKYWETVGIIKGLKAVQVAFKNATRIKDNFVKKQNAKHSN